MRVFVAGATGVLGRALLPALIAKGHTVFGLARTPEKMSIVTQLGGKPLHGDVLDAERLRLIITKIQPEAIVNLATKIPLKLRLNKDHWQENDEVRLQGTSNLLKAAGFALGLKLFVQESMDQVCETQGDRWIDENAPRSRHPFLHATLQMEDMIRTAKLPATLLRFSVLNAPDSWHTQQSVTAIKRGLLPIIGDGSAFVGMIHVADAIQAIVCALQQPGVSAGQTFNVVDDAPSRMRDILPYAAQLLKAPPPRTVPSLMAKLIVGALTIDVLTQSHRTSNARIKHCLGFAPRFPTYRETWADIVQTIGSHNFASSEDLRKN